MQYYVDIESYVAEYLIKWKNIHGIIKGEKHIEKTIGYIVLSDLLTMALFG